MNSQVVKRGAIVSVVAAVAMLLSACLLTPGKFVSNLDLRRNGQFAFTYKGEVSMFGLAQLAAMKAKDAVFTPMACYKDELPPPPAPKTSKKKGKEEDDFDIVPGGMAERECTADEIAQQKKDWEEDRKADATRDKKDMDEMKAALGGLDPTDPKSIEEFAVRLRRQAGWNAVVYKGDGMFDVDFAVTGRLDHDFIFPVIEKFPTTVTFVQVLRRNDGTVRVDAPGFFAGGQNNVMGQTFGMGMMGKMGGNKDMPKMPELDGAFTITTDGEILSNNTDEGPAAVPTGKRLAWAVNVRATAAPTALIRLK